MGNKIVNIIGLLDKKIDEKPDNCYFNEPDGAEDI